MKPEIHASKASPEARTKLNQNNPLHLSPCQVKLSEGHNFRPYLFGCFVQTQKLKAITIKGFQFRLLLKHGHTSTLDRKVNLFN